MSRHTLVLLVVSVVVVAVWGARLMGFIGRPRCELMTGPNEVLRDVAWERLDHDGLSGWITTTFGVGEGAIRRNDDVSDPHHHRIHWEAYGDDYTVDTRSGEARYIAIRVVRGTPRAEDVLDCLGPPDFYRATYLDLGMHNELYAELWYVDEGIIAGFWGMRPTRDKEPPPLNERSEVDTIHYQRFNDPAQMIQGVTVARHSLDTYPPKPWPGSFEAIEIEIDPSILGR